MIEQIAHLLPIAFCIATAIYIYNYYFCYVRKYPPGGSISAAIFRQSPSTRLGETFAQATTDAMVTRIRFHIHRLPSGANHSRGKTPEVLLALKNDALQGRPYENPSVSLLQTTKNSGVLFADGVAWQEQRRFTMQQLRNLGMGRNVMEAKIQLSIETMIEHVDDLISGGGDDGCVLDMHWPLLLCVANVINELLFGYHYDNANSEKFKKYEKNVAYVLYESMNRSSVHFIDGHPWLRHLPFVGYWGWRQLRSITLEINAFIRNEIAVVGQHFVADSEATNFVEAYLHEIDRQRVTLTTGAEQRMQSICEDQLVHVVTDFWIAGMETTTTTMRWAVLAMIAYPDVQTTLQAEIDAQIGANRLPIMADRIRMPFTQAVIAELQRWSNIVPLNLPHKSLADTSIGTVRIPAMCRLLILHSAILDDEDIFANPTRFDPYRFIEADNCTPKTTTMSYNIPFGAGKRSCAGESLAKMELFLMLVALLQRYRFEAEEDRALLDLSPTFGITMSPKDYRCRVSIRSSM